MSSVKSKDVKRMIAKLQATKTGVLLRAPVTRYFERVGEMVLNSARARSPIKTARTRTSLTRSASEGIWRMSGQPFPKRLRVGTNVKHRGVSYPQILDESPRHTYARGPREGQQTQGWFSGSIRRTGRKRGMALKQLGEELTKEMQV